MVRFRKLVFSTYPRFPFVELLFFRFPCFSSRTNEVFDLRHFVDGGDPPKRLTTQLRFFTTARQFWPLSFRLSFMYPSDVEHGSLFGLTAFQTLVSRTRLFRTLCLVSPRDFVPPTSPPGTVLSIFFFFFALRFLSEYARLRWSPIGVVLWLRVFSSQGDRAAPTLPCGYSHQSPSLPFATKKVTFFFLRTNWYPCASSRTALRGTFTTPFPVICTLKRDPPPPNPPPPNPPNNPPPHPPPPPPPPPPLLQMFFCSQCENISKVFSPLPRRSRPWLLAPFSRPFPLCTSLLPLSRIFFLRRFTLAVTYVSDSRLSPPPSARRGRLPGNLSIYFPSPSKMRLRRFPPSFTFYRPYVPSRRRQPTPAEQRGPSFPTPPPPLFPFRRGALTLIPRPTWESNFND